MHQVADCMSPVAVQAFAWCAVFVLSVLIVASRKHYTVDVLIAWYVVPLVFYAMLRRWTTKRPISEEPWPHRSLAEDDALQLEEVVVHGSMAAPEVGHASCHAHCFKMQQLFTCLKPMWLSRTPTTPYYVI